MTSSHAGPRAIRLAGSAVLIVAAVALGSSAGAGQASEPPSPATATPAQTTYPLSGIEAETARRTAYQACLRSQARHTRTEIRRARRLSGRRLARARRHIRRHRTLLRRACVREHGRTPGRVTGLSARASSRRRIVLRFTAPGTDGNNPPAARTYVIKQSRRPIRGARGFRRAQALCRRRRCRFAGVTDIGARLTLTVTDLRRRTTYYYAVAARDNVTGKLGPRSRTAKARTR